MKRTKIRRSELLSYLSAKSFAIGFSQAINDSTNHYVEIFEEKRFEVGDTFKDILETHPLNDRYRHTSTE